MAELIINTNDAALVKQNIQTDLILISEDKVEIILMKNKKALSSAHSWVTPTSLFLSFLATLITADFKTTLGLTGENWKVVFIILLIASFVWLVFAAFSFIKYKGKTSTEYMIAQMNKDKENK